MAKYSINDTTLDNIADAIRTKTGDTANLTPLQMPAAILGITGGGSGGGSGADFGALNHVEITAASEYSSYDMPDLSPYISDFSQIAAMYWYNSRGVYIYLKGIGTEHGYHPEYRITYIRGYSGSSTVNSYFAYAGNPGNTEDADDTFYFLDGTVDAPLLKYHRFQYGKCQDSTMTTPFAYKLIMYYEGGSN